MSIAIVTRIDTIYLNVDLLAGPHRTSQISYEAVDSVVRELSLIEALMCFFSIAIKYSVQLDISRYSFSDSCIGYYYVGESSGLGI